MIRKILSGLRPADALNFAFLFSLSAVTAIFLDKANGSSGLLLIYSTLILIQAMLVLLRERNGLLRITHDLIFPTISILVIFESLERLVHYINPRDIDPLLIRLDYLLFNGYPTVMLEAVMRPVLTDILQLAYSSYYFLPITLGVLLKLRRDDAAFDRSLFLIMLCFYLSYVGYMLMPALGPRYTMHHLQNTELQGFMIAGPIQEFLNRLEGIKRDAFPSGHTGIALTVLYLAYRYEKRLFVVFLPVVFALIFSTVYCRYHYVVDVIGGVLLALIAVVLGERYYGYWSKRVDTLS